MYPRVYVCELRTPEHFYVGTTLREPWHREREHAEGWGAKFTTKHGFKSMLFAEIVQPGTASRLEDDLTVALMCRYGWGACRGGERTAQKESVLRRYLPPCLQCLGPRDVLPLHLRPVSKLPAELRALVNRFEVLCGLEDSN
jgi:predicted GIY-YIG superfamily endonuclease